MTEHSPGPWRYDFVGPSKVRVVRDADGWDLNFNNGQIDPEVRLANMRLVAAAPEMKDALQRLLRRYVVLASSGDCGFWDPDEEQEVIDARTALAKAKGEKL